MKEDTKLNINGARLSKFGNVITIIELRHAEKLNVEHPAAFTKDQFIAERARGAYIVAVCRPDATYSFSRLLQYAEPSEREFKDLKKFIELCKSSNKKGLKFFPFDSNLLAVGLFVVDAGFTTNKDFTSQLGFIIVLIDGNIRANIVHYGSTKSKALTRSVLATELFAMVQGLDICSGLRLSINGMFDKNIPMHIHTDSRSVFDCMANIKRTVR